MMPSKATLVLHDGFSSCNCLATCLCTYLELSIAALLSTVNATHATSMRYMHINHVPLAIYNPMVFLAT